MPIHTFPSTGEAYDACQTNPAINDGDILHIPSEGVVGVADTWPCAVTVKAGDLHTKCSKSSWTQFSQTTGITVDEINAAISFAKVEGYETVDA